MGKETRRLYGVMNAHLASHDFFAGLEFSIADIAIFAWVWRAGKHKVDIASVFPHVKRWYDAVSTRPAVRHGLQVPSAEEMERPRLIPFPEFDDSMSLGIAKM